MDNTAFIFKIAASILVPPTMKKPVNMFIYSAKKAEEFYQDSPDFLQSLYGKFSILNDNYEAFLDEPPDSVG